VGDEAFAMTYRAVDLYVKSHVGTPLAGVLVRIYNQAGSVIFTESTTDADGHAGFLLDDIQAYQVRSYKFQVSFQNPQFFQPSQEPNIFDLVGTVLGRSIATDPRLCRASGIFRRPNGAAAPNVDIQFTPKFKPVVLEGSAVVTPKLSVRTDRMGFVELDLIRFGEYDVVVQGMEDIYQTIWVPDSPWVNLPDLILPVVDTVDFAPAGPFALTMGTDLIVTPTVRSSDFNVLDGAALNDVLWASSDPEVALVQASQTSLLLRPLTPGSCSITATRKNTSIIRYPDVPITFLSSNTVIVT